MAADRQRSAGWASAAALLAAVTACAGAPTDAAAQTFTSEHHTFRVATVVEGLEHPWGMAFLPDGSILVTERRRLRLVRNGVLEPEPIAGVPEVWARGQGGLPTSPTPRLRAEPARLPELLEAGAERGDDGGGGAVW